MWLAGAERGGPQDWEPPALGTGLPGGIAPSLRAQAAMAAVARAVGCGNGALADAISWGSPVGYDRNCRMLPAAPTTACHPMPPEYPGRQLARDSAVSAGAAPADRPYDSAALPASAAGPAPAAAAAAPAAASHIAALAAAGAAAADAIAGPAASVAAHSTWGLADENVPEPRRIACAMAAPNAAADEPAVFLVGPRACPPLTYAPNCHHHQLKSCHTRHGTGSAQQRYHQLYHRLSAAFHPRLQRS